MHRSKIEWCRNPDGSLGWVWNPITGCLNGCEYCYARKLANGRLKTRYLANKNLADFKPEDIPNGEVSQMYIQKCFSDPFYPRLWEDRLNEAYALLYTIKPRGIFVCDMSDLFGIGIPENWTRRVLEAIRMNPYHRFYLLTKQPQNLIKFSPFPDNCWVGVSLTGVEKGGYLEALHQVEASVKYISFEPLLARVIEESEWLVRTFQIMGISRVIIGACTGTKADMLKLIERYPELTLMPYGNKWTAQPKIEWVQEIVQACDKAGVKVFLKNNLKPLIESSGMGKCLWAAREWVMCKYPVLRQEMPDA